MLPPHKSQSWQGGDISHLQAAKSLTFSLSCCLQLRNVNLWSSAGDPGEENHIWEAKSTRIIALFTSTFFKGKAQKYRMASLGGCRRSIYGPKFNLVVPRTAVECLMLLFICRRDVCDNIPLCPSRILHAPKWVRDSIRVWSSLFGSHHYQALVLRILDLIFFSQHVSLVVTESIARPSGFSRCSSCLLSHPGTERSF